MPLPESDPAAASQSSTPSPAVVAIAGWLLPGAGYWLVGHRARALVAGVTIIILFMSGILIGGVRSIQVPSYGENGGPLHLWHELKEEHDYSANKQVFVRTGRSRIDERAPFDDDRNHRRSELGPAVVTDLKMLVGDVANKPWSICQVLAGPVAIANGAWSVWASRGPVLANGKVDSPGQLSHSRVNEIAVLYTAVAGMLNLIVIIDAAARAAHAQREGVVARGSS
jgi:hypothetical protein